MKMENVGYIISDSIAFAFKNELSIEIKARSISFSDIPETINRKDIMNFLDNAFFRYFEEDFFIIENLEKEVLVTYLILERELE
jgi:hypothetical protein